MNEKAEIIAFLKDNLADAKSKRQDYDREITLIDNLRNKVKDATGTNILISMSLSYEECKAILESLLDHAEEIKQYELRDHYLYIEPRFEYQDDTIILKDDLIKIPYDCQIQNVLEFLKYEHEAANQEVLAYKRLKMLIDDRKNPVKKQLGLAYIDSSSFCEDEDYLVALDTLKSILPDLKALNLSGLTIIVSDSSSIRDDGRIYMDAYILAEDFLSFLKMNIKHIRTLHHQDQTYNKIIGELEAEIKRKLLMLYIYPSYDLANEHYIQGLQNIFKAISTLQSLDHLDGSSICIDTNYRVGEFGTIHIPYNFTLADLETFLPNSFIKRLK